MRIKRLEVTGFKSFCDRSVLSFHDPITGVRLKLQDLREKYAYYAKVEMMVEGVTAGKAESVMGDFVGAALPAVERCLPDWGKVREAELAGRPIPGELAEKSE